MPAQRTLDLGALVAYFEGSCFEVLALDHAGASLRLCREAPRPTVALAAPSVGRIGFAPGRVRLPRAGDTVQRDECLFTIRRFKASIEVKAPASGRIASLPIEPGEFVEFGQHLAAIEAT